MQDQEYVKILSLIITITMTFAFFRSFFKSMDGKFLNLNNVELFTIKDIQSPPVPAQVVCQMVVEKPKPRKPKTTTKKSQPKPKEDNSNLKRDCDAAMKSLKVSANERKYLLTKVFNDYSPKTVEEFIKLAFMRPKA